MTERYSENEALYREAEERVRTPTLKREPFIRDGLELNPGTTTRDGFLYFDKADRYIPDVDGWKVHLSVKKEDVPRALKIMADIVKRTSLLTFKVTRPWASTLFDQKDEHQAGKMFTLYGTGSEDWSEILTHIEAAFNQNKIIPSHPVSGDKPVRGSRYAYYRNDRHPETNEYLSAETLRVFPEEVRHNPFNLKDEIGRLDLRSVYAGAMPGRNPMPPSIGLSDVMKMDWHWVRSPRYGICLRATPPERGADVAQTMRALENHRIKSGLVPSQTFKQHFLQVDGEESKAALLDLFGQEIAEHNWEPMTSPRNGGFVMRLAVPGLNEEQLATVSKCLSLHGFPTKRDYSGTFKMEYLQVAGKDAARLGEFIYRMKQKPSNRPNSRPGTKAAPAPGRG